MNYIIRWQGKKRIKLKVIRKTALIRKHKGVRAEMPEKTTTNETKTQTKPN